MAKKSDIPEEERALFREAMSDVESQAVDRVEPYHRRRAPRPLPHRAEEGQDVLADLSVETPEFFEFRRPGIQRRLYQDLARGLIPPEQTLDLHGMRVTEARTAFARFLKASLARRLRCVRIVHGKGRNSAGNQPVLKQKTYQWLLQSDPVLAFTTAPRWDGGTGATYVLLSRKAGP
ncbi:MAG: DNA mismatch repair protein MutS [Gammaproteobacteria bacterium]|nr:MAG: DNA mismatch repair protein MutS [Gammaproteobacteria bacterium]